MDSPKRQSKRYLYLEINICPNRCMSISKMVGEITIMHKSKKKSGNFYELNEIEAKLFLNKKKQH